MNKKEIAISFGVALVAVVVGLVIYSFAQKKLSKSSDSESAEIKLAA